MFLREVLRDAPAGQLARTYLGWTIAPYEDEKEGYSLQQPTSHAVALSVAHKDEADPDGISEKSSADPAQGKDSDIESSAMASTAPRQDENAIRDIERMATEKEEPPNTTQPNPNEVSFSPEDRDNPHNWSTGKKVFAFAQICLLTFSIYSASAIITPAEGVFQEMWGVSGQVSALVLSMYVLGYGLGPLIFSPLSEMPMVGRNVPYMGSFAIFIIMTAVGSGVSNFAGLVVIRFLQGFFGGPVLATGAASASDIFPFNKVPYALSFWAFFAYGGPALGPVMSGFAIPLDDWRWGMWETLILSGFTFLVLFFFLPETNADYILSQRAKRLRAKTGDTNLLSRSESRSGNKNWVKLTIHHLTMPFRITVLDPSVGFINLYTALVYGVYYSFFESFPLVYIGTYGFTIGIMGAVFICVIIGAGIGLTIYTLLLVYIYEPYTMTKGIGSPEYRLVPGLFAAALAPAGMFIFGYAAKPDITWVGPTVGIALYAAASFILINCIFVYLPISYPRFAASIFAANGFLRSAMACGAIHFSQPLFGNLGVGNGCAILGSVAAACAALFVLLYWFGPTLRARSRFAETY
ncbi:cycloheximide resistance protein [Lophiostoma macrostomum CBS 122681]|uniref:Cycloheximide resistance protein n=1 Tax=Lophiostoma macrostomum CBS 122681 TaxID=1314788 RepID=A0A6A6TFC9_9PLEO|nr:cycloheximide resistance protein [Lophiostoma macrostomum CBS 122681]